MGHVPQPNSIPSHGGTPHACVPTGGVPMELARRHERYGLFRKVSWDFFTGKTGTKAGFIGNISKGGCLLKTSDPIEHRRWIRLIIRDDFSNMFYSAVGRIVRRQDALESHGSGDVTLYRFGVEFTQPGNPLDQDPALILAFSSKNPSVRSCLSLNIKSS